MASPSPIEPAPKRAKAEEHTGTAHDDDDASSHQIPLIDLPDLDKESDELIQMAAHQVTNALKTSGFLLVKSQRLPLKLQKAAIQSTRNILNAQDNPSVITHPTDPKKYVMIDSKNQIAELVKDDDDDTNRSTLTEYWTSLEHVKRQVLKCMEIGLELPADYFINLHKQDKSALRLLHYPAPSSESAQEKQEQEQRLQKIRCKPHSDYGSITLLLTDGVPGLQALIDDKWTWVPHVEGALVVNIGSLLSNWTSGNLLATLHRVVGDDDSIPRTSLAFFADPDQDISASLKLQPNNDNKKDMTVADYVKWRSGGTDKNRSGLDFTEGERSRADKASEG